MLGVIAHQMGQGEMAVALISKAINISPSSSMYCNLGLALKGQGELDAAIGSYRKALSMKPDYAEAHNNLGLALQQLGDLDAAIASYRKALKFKPDNAEAYNNLGLTLGEQGKHEAAIESYHKALSIKPGLAEAHNNLGNALKVHGRLELAVECYREALLSKPDYADAHNNLGGALLDQGKLEEAAVSYQKAVACKPDFAGAHSNLLMSLQYGGHSTAELLGYHLNFAQRFEAPLRGSWPSHDNNLDPQRRLRIGFVSGDLCEHSVGFFMESVLAHLDRQALDVFLYPAHSQADALTDRLRRMGFTWRSLVTLSDDRAARCIREDGIDILVDLSGHTAHNRLTVFARKPAPVQVTWLGYSSTTGLQAMDYVLCDRHVVPPDESGDYVERLWRLPDSYLCFTPPREEMPVVPLPALRNGSASFGCFNSLTKMNDAVVALWARVLQTVGDSRLFLKTRQLDDASVQQATRQRFAACGIDPQRLVLEGWSSSRSDSLACYNRVDIALDPFPYAGTTTTLEALWMGVPVISLHGDRFIAHVGESILHNVGLPDWIAADREAYVAIAAAHAADISGLAALRTRLRSQLLASPLCDAPRFARNLEAAFRGMWQTYCSQEHKAKRVAPPMGANGGEAAVR